MIEIPGTKTVPVAMVRTCTSTIREYTKVAVKTPRATWLPRSRRNVRSTRGENWLLASCSATIVIVNTSPVNVIMDVAMVVSSCWALVGPPVNASQPRTSSARSTRTVSNDRTTAPATNRLGTNQNPVRSDSRTPASSVF